LSVSAPSRAIEWVLVTVQAKCLAFSIRHLIASSAPMRRAKGDIAAAAGSQVACLRLTCDIDKREPARVPE